MRLEHLDKGKVELILELLKKSLSEAGFSKVTAAMKTNKFVGEICGKEAILNENSYWYDEIQFRIPTILLTNL